MYDENNIFAKIIRGEIPCDKVYEDGNVLAFKDIFPDAPVHILILPKGKYISFDDFSQKADSGEIANFFKAVQKIAAQSGLIGSGYRLVANHGSDALQAIQHFHVHILGGKPLGGLLPNSKKIK